MTAGAEPTIGSRGEFGLVADITARLAGPEISRDVVLGPGDDAAVVAAPDGRVVATTDVLVEGRHFRRDWSSATDVGRKAAAQSLADIAAMGARPTALLVGFGAPADLPLAWALELADGLREECALVGVSVVGGDVVRADSAVISVTALGDLEGRAPVLRSGAAPGDLVAVAGRLGWAAAGLAVLQRGFRSPRVLIDAHRRPEPPYALGPAAAVAGSTGMCDVSDGLLADVGHVAQASGVVIDLDPSAFVVPGPLRDAGAALGVDPLVWILTGGDDHALVATFPASVVRPAGFVVVGVVEACADRNPGVLVGGSPWSGPAGHDHFG